MDQKTRALPECGFRFLLVPEGIVFQAGPRPLEGVRERVAGYSTAPSVRSPATYLDRPFLTDFTRPWGYGGNLYPHDAPADRRAWLAPWPTRGNVDARLRESKVLAASVSVLAHFVRQYAQVSGFVGDKAPLFLPDPMVPVQEEAGAAINAEFHRSVERWIGPGPMRVLEEVCAIMCRVYATMHSSLLVDSVPSDYYAGVGSGDEFKIKLAVGNAAGMVTDDGRPRGSGYPIALTSHNIDSAAQQLTLLAALIEIAGMAEAALGDGA